MRACSQAASPRFLQQATHLTGGIYLRPKLRGALLQYLLVKPSLISTSLYAQQLFHCMMEYMEGSCQLISG